MVYFVCCLHVVSVLNSDACGEDDFGRLQFFSLFESLKLFFDVPFEVFMLAVIIVGSRYHFRFLVAGRHVVDNGSDRLMIKGLVTRRGRSQRDHLATLRYGRQSSIRRRRRLLHTHGRSSRLRVDDAGPSAIGTRTRATVLRISFCHRGCQARYVDL